MSNITPEIIRRMVSHAAGHIPVFLFESDFIYKSRQCKIAVTLMIRQDNSVYYRCILNEDKTLDIELLYYAFIPGWTDLDAGMNELSRAIGEVIEKRDILTKRDIA